MEHLAALPSGYNLNEYRIERVLGTGGFGITYLAHDENLKKLVAIKEYLPNDLAVRQEGSTVLAKSRDDQDEFEWGLDRFLDEARILARFKHPNVIEVYRFFEAHGTGYIVMEFADGETLSGRLKSAGQLDIGELKALLFPIIDGLVEVHAGDVLHRDIKPGNIIIRSTGSPVLLDFGAARQAIESRSQPVTAIVTPGYAPIEQYSSRGGQGAWSDIYALAAVAYRCLTGEAPIDATDRIRDDPLQSLTEHFPDSDDKAFLTALDWALSVHEDERPQSLDKWRAALVGKEVAPRNPTPSPRQASQPDARESRDEPDTIRGVSPPPPPAKPGGINKLAIGLAVVCLVVVGVVAVLFLPSDQSEQEAWRRAATDDTLISYQLYLDFFPDGEFTSRAKSAIDIKLDEKDWREASELGTERALMKYLSARPNGMFAADAQLALAELAPPIIDNEGISKVADVSEEETAWQKALRSNSISGYATYLESFGDGEHASDATVRKAALERTQADEQAIRVRVAKGLVQLGYNAGSSPDRLSDELRVAIRSFESDQRLDTTGRPSAELASKIEQAIAGRELVTEVQSELIRLGYDIDDDNGLLDESTRDAIRHFEEAIGETVTGQASRGILAEMGDLTAKPLLTGDALRDCSNCPELVAIIPRPFQMGDTSGRGDENERPVRTVEISEPFAMAVLETTRQDFATFVSSTGYKIDERCWVQEGGKTVEKRERSWRDPGFSQTGDHPAVCINAEDADAYASWLSEEAGRTYRIPTEAEWEYVARAGSTAQFHFGSDIGVLCRYGNGADEATTWDWRYSCDDGYRWTSPAGSFRANGFGVQDLNGNAFEWTADCWNETYRGAPSDGSAWLSGDCKKRVLRGGSWISNDFNLRSANRIGSTSAVRSHFYGFRVVRSLSRDDGLLSTSRRR